LATDLATGVVAANRPYTSVDELAGRAVAWLAALSPFGRLLEAGLLGTTFQWLSTECAGANACCDRWV